MNIYYVGSLNIGGTCKARMDALIQHGHNVKSFDISSWMYSRSKLLRSLAHRFNIGPIVWNLNKEFINSIKKTKSIDLIWIDRNRWLYPETIIYVKNFTGAKLMHYTPDAQIIYYGSRFFNAAIPLFDLMVTTKPYEVDLYEAYGAKKVYLALQGFDERFIKYKNSKSHASMCSDICFVGHYEDHYDNLISELAYSKLNLKVWGNDWTKKVKNKDLMLPYIKGSGLWGVEYLKALSNAKIALGLISKLVPDTSTTRSFEIPAIGTFMLAERTIEHKDLFKEGVEAEFFDSKEEMNDKAIYYLNNNSKREKIAEAGRKRCISSNYGSSDQLKQIIRLLKNC